MSNQLTQHISDTGQVVAAAHLIFNLTISLMFLMLLDPILKFSERKTH
jgi:Na+/phosphate symporter